MIESDRVSEADRALIARMEAEVLAAQRLQGFVSGHIAATYALAPGDEVRDGLIIRATPPVEEPD